LGMNQNTGICFVAGPPRHNESEDKMAGRWAPTAEPWDMIRRGELSGKERVVASVLAIVCGAAGTAGAAAGMLNGICYACAGGAVAFAVGAMYERAAVLGR
jgi:hypothetical protein